MEPLALATTIVNLIAPYLAKAGEVMASKAGETAWKKAKDLYAAIKDRLTDDSYAAQTLKRLEENPASESRRAILTAVLEEKIRDDLVFAKALEELLADAKQASADSVMQQVTVSAHAQTGDITQIGKVEGSVNLGRKQ